MFSIAWPWLLLLLPLPWLLKPKRVSKNNGGHLQLPGIANADQVISSHADKPSRKLYWLMWACLLCALVRPQWLGEPIELPSEGRDLMLAVDLSGSMQIEDMVVEGKTVDRLTLIKHVIGDFIERRNGDRLGLILFADHAYLQAPLTQDRRSVAKFLADSQIGLVGKQTAIGESIALAVRRFDNVNDSNRVLILLTDGSNNAGNIEPEVAARIAAERNVTIYTVGVGAEILERRSIFGTEKVNPSADLDEAQLQQLAEMTNGHYFRARNSEELEEIYQKIDELEPVSRDQLTYRPQSELFYWPLLLALLISLSISLRSQMNLPKNLTSAFYKEDK
ncbi:MULTISPECIES: VWA domain-containing protein [unclassified Shewanella]|uniref:vWA domain-containing protein n=1 Tax=unclassified Shewanella TaxID=196818 RepID=UPI000C81A2F7|nr:MULTISPECIES: VWA domain-containing protein [unclassified Shewanella]MDO6639117.1 VWA domain-containing protein [Shewanella sp. 5_MG-2023]MDO6776248.1 VWA domain-containing protein [Shewanella sp. 3_MG-2023]PMG31096.1 IMP dehydrogenase [Shewanella sp. 10N.286.52.C2]PMG51771.1 IMP dehydrogenase [Shewanella sp. 10N.286.52.B9]PMH96934.1 IMP dehydrogenase [Shewanella sp. 10N.286.48.A6]